MLYKFNVHVALLIFFNAASVSLYEPVKSKSYMLSPAEGLFVTLRLPLV